MGTRLPVGVMLEANHWVLCGLEGIKWPLLIEVFANRRNATVNSEMLSQQP